MKKKQPAPRAATHVAGGSRVVGEISGDAELVIDGQVEGQIELRNRVVIGSGGRVEGRIDAAAVELGGKVEGNIRGHERVEILASGSLEGDIVAPRVVIAEGAFFKGKVEMTDGRPKVAAAAKKSTPAADKRPQTAAAAKGGGAAAAKGGGAQGDGAQARPTKSTAATAKVAETNASTGPKRPGKTRL